MTALKRILSKDLKSIEKHKLNDLGIYVEFNEENFFEAKVLIKGPKDSLYEHGYLFFIIKFPKNYPWSPPDISYISRNNIRIHPNLYVGGHSSGFGKVCLSILGTWSGPKLTSVMDISTILLSIQSLLDNNPLHHEPGYENNTSKLNQNYNETIAYNTFNSLLMKNLINIPSGFECFQNILNDDYLKNYEEIKKKLLYKIETTQKKVITLSFYRISCEINYSDLYTRFLNIKI